MPKAKSCEFYNLPVRYSSADYREALDFIIKKYSKIDGLISIYDWGGPFTHGISDMDLVFVFDRSRVSAMPLLSRVFYALKKKFRYVARHPFFYIDDVSFQSIRYVYPDADFKLLYGKNIKIKKISHRDKIFSKIALLSDIIVRHYPRDFLEQSIIRRINARDMLLRLNSLKHSVKTIEMLTKEKNNGWNGKLRQIERLRKNWFGSSDFGSLASLNDDAVKITLEITEKFRDFLAGSGLVKVYSGNNAEYSGTRNNAFFVKDWSKEKALDHMSGLIIGKRMFFSILPIELAPQQIEYSRYEGPISRYIKNRLKHNLKYRLKYSGIIRKRAAIFNKQAELAAALRHSDFVAFFGFGYRNNAGINNLVLNLLRKYRD